MAKKSSRKNSKKMSKNAIIAVGIVVLVVLFYYVFAYQNGAKEDGSISLSLSEQSGVASDNFQSLPPVVGETYFGYMKSGYIMNIEVGGKMRRLELKSLNEEGTVDIVMGRAYNVALGETVFADYTYDNIPDISFRLDGVDLYNNRFSGTIIYYGAFPEQVNADMD